jgi:hypothetical protein
MLSAISCGKAPLPKTDWQKELLKGEVHVVYEKRFYLDSLGMLNDSTYWDSIEVRPDLTIEFNSKGYATERTDLPCFFGGGTTTYIYSETNYRLQRINYGTNMGTGSGESILEYDSKGRLAKVISVYPNEQDSFVTSFKYDKRNNAIKEVHDNILDTNDFYITRKYDKFNRIIEENRFDLKNDVPKTKTIFQFDSIGNEVYSELISLDKSNWGWKTWKIYDKNGNLVKDSSLYNDYGKLWYPGVDLFKYEFDKNENWIQKIVINDGKPKEVVRRKIKYW